MAVELTSPILRILLSPLVWIGIIFFMGLFAFGGLWVRKQRKLEYPCLVLRKTGNGKVDVKVMKAGWFDTKKYLWGLFDWGGEQELLTGGFRKPVNKIQAGSTIDFHEINGKKGLICRRKDDDPKIVVPLTKVEISNDEILAKIASADLRDASVNIIKQSEHETRNRTQEIVQWVLMGGIILLVLVVIIMTYQFTSRSQAESWGYVMQASDIVTRSAPPISAP